MTETLTVKANVTVTEKVTESLTVRENVTEKVKVIVKQ